MSAQVDGLPERPQVPRTLFVRPSGHKTGKEPTRPRVASHEVSYAAEPDHMLDAMIADEVFRTRLFCRVRR